MWDVLTNEEVVEQVATTCDRSFAAKAVLGRAMDASKKASSKTACFLCVGHSADLILPRVIVRVHQEGIMIPFLTPEYNIHVDLMSMTI